MSDNKAVGYILAAVAGIIIIWLIFDNDEKRKKIALLQKQNKEKDEINKKLQYKIEETKEIPIDVRKQLEILIEEYKNLDDNVTKELMSASSLIEIREYSKAIGVLTKIIENLLKEKFSSDITIIEKAKKKGRKNPALADYLQHALDVTFITAEEFHFANGLRELRNDEAHELNPKQTRMLTSSAFLTAIDLILKLSKKILGIKNQEYVIAK